MTKAEAGDIRQLLHDETDSLSQAEKHWLNLVLASPFLIDTSTEKPASSGRAVFLGHAFSTLIEKDPVISPQHPQRLLLEWIMVRLRNKGAAVHCALEREQWGAELMSPTGALLLDADQVTKANALVTYPQDSFGAFMELGFADAGNVPILILWRGNNFLSQPISALTEEQYYIKGIIGRKRANGIPTMIVFDTAPDLAAYEKYVFPGVEQFLQDLTII